MVKEIQKNGQTPYIFAECGLAYGQKEWAQKRQRWCRQHQSSNVETPQHAVTLE